MPHAAPLPGELPGALLGPDDPAPFEIVGAERQAPLLLVCDHASRTVPRCLVQLGLPDALLLRHIGWDIGAALVTRRLSELLGAPAVLAGYSRLVIDCNRDPANPSSMPEMSDGVEVPGNRGLTEAARAARIAACFDPYHAAIAAELARFAACGVAPVVFSVHSFTPVMNGIARPWHVGILWDKDPRVAVPLIAELAAADPRRVVGDNEPYSAREPAGYTIRRHAEPAGLPSAAVEIRQDLIDTELGALDWAESLAAALHPVLARRDIYRSKHFR